MRISHWSRPLRWRGDNVFNRSVVFEREVEDLIKRLSLGEAPQKDDDQLRYRLHQELEIGSGVLLHDSPTLRLLPAQPFRTTFNAFCVWLGMPVSIDRQGNYLKEVRDVGKRDTLAAPQRGHLTSQELAFHSDRADITVLACWSPAASGGAFRIRSSVDAVAQAEEAAAEWLPLLKTAIPHDLRDEGGDKWALVPLLTESENCFAMRYIRKFNDSVIRHGVEQNSLVKKMLTEMDEIIERPGDYAELHFQKGRVVIVNNHITLHARTRFENSETYQRCLLRCWLSSEFTRPLPSAFAPLFHSIEAGTLRGGVAPGGTEKG